MTEAPLEDVLARVPLFAALPRDELARLGRALRLREVPGGEILFREAECGEHFYVVVEGEIEVVKALDTPAERRLGLRRAGEFVGEMSLLNRDGRRTATVRARGPARLLELTRADFDDLLRRHPLLAYDMVRLLSERLSASSNARVRELLESNQQLAAAYAELQAAQAQVIEKEKLDRELELAHEIQVGMLPRELPRLPGYGFGARTLPARAVGGDFFDFIPLPDGRMGVVVGDVAGKGMPAALFMALARALLRAEGSRGDAPAEVLRSVNAHLLTMNQAGLFVTVIYGILDPGTGRLDYARAAHEYPLLAEPNGGSRAFTGGRGQPLGVLDEPELDEQTTVLAPGGTLLFYSDGASDARSPAGAMFDAERVLGLLSANAALSAQPLCDRLLQAVLDYQSSAPQHDDITLVAVQRAAL